jgi:hypothetical protein
MRPDRLAKYLSTATLAVVLLMSAEARSDVPLVYTTIEPGQIALGESARLTITNLGNVNDAFTMPVVPGLHFEIVGRTHQIELINGTTLASSSVVVRVTPQIAGIFTIPAITPKSQPLVLQVNTGHANANSLQAPQGPQAPQPARPITPPIFSGQTLPNGVRLTEDGSAFVRLVVPKREVYVGESVPVEIELGMRSGFVSSVNGLPKLNGDNFTLNNLSHQPDRTESVIGGERFVLLTWHSLLAVVKPGTFSVAAEAPLTVRIRTKPRRDSLLDDQFGDPFLQNFFGVTVPKDINAVSPSLELTALALPTAGRPSDFRGAVGTFKVTTEVSPATAAAGDPVTLRLHVNGSGNFDRVDTSMLDHLDHWKTYPPKSSLNLSDALGFKGEKIFEQPLIASKPGTQSIPALSFSYFDPTARRYETARSSPLAVTISPSLADNSLTAPTTVAGAEPSATNKQPGLRPDHAGVDSLAASLIPLYLQPKFLAIPALLALVLAGGWWRTRRRPDEIARERADKAAIARLLSQMDAAARAGDAAAFFAAARGAIRQAMAARWRVAPDDVTTAELGARLERDGDIIRRLFALADEAQYAGHALNDTDFVRWSRVVRHQLTGEAS